jgi:hypothetical protein
VAPIIEAASMPLIDAGRASAVLKELLNKTEHAPGRVFRPVSNSRGDQVVERGGRRSWSSDPP